jgi:hypothetical protein
MGWSSLELMNKVLKCITNALRLVFHHLEVAPIYPLIWYKFNVSPEIKVLFFSTYVEMYHTSRILLAIYF